MIDTDFENELKQKLQKWIDEVNSKLAKLGVERKESSVPITSINQLEVGNEIRLPWVHKYQHGATIIITKVNQKSFKGIEKERSYRPGAEWIIHKNSSFRAIWYETLPDGSKLTRESRI